MSLYNPYTPGAGFPPSFFAGRDDTIENAEQTLLYVQNGIVQRSKIYYGLRGVGKQMETTSKSIEPLRSQLIHKGFIYATSYGEIDFTVPQFDKYLLRINPNLIIDKDRTM